MLSRVADSIYWMSRYIERAENVARFIDVNFNLMLDLPLDSAQQWQPLVDITGDTKQFDKRYGEASQQKVTQFLTFDSENVNSIVSCFRAARENARSVREVISSEMWEQLNEAYLMVNDAARHDGSLVDPQDLFASVKMASHQFAGVTDATMTHGEGWHFLQLGRMLERADKTSRIVDVKYFLLLPTIEDVGTTVDDMQWAAVLRSASALEMYHKGHGLIAPTRVVEFLLLNREFPRAIHYCLMAARRSVHAISGTPDGMFRNPVEQLLGALCSELAYAQIDDIILEGLHEYLDILQTRMNQVGAGIHETFFAARVAPPSAAKQRQRQRQKQRNVIVSSIG
jgi:uncharacterized alpha-E superfamily protein